MRNKGKKTVVYLLVFTLILLSVIACRIEAPRLVLNEDPTPVPTKIITKVITKIVVPPTSTPLAASPLPTKPAEPTLTPTWNPLDAPIYYPLPDCVASRLYIGDSAFVSLVGGPNAIRTDINLRTDTNIIAYAEPGEILEIIGGPQCSDGYIMWFVEMKDGLRGFTPEGDGNNYWLWPVAP